LAGVFAFCALAVHGVHRYVFFREGYGISSARLEEVQTIAWLRQHANPSELVLAPPESAPWIATAPIHSFASHWLLCMDCNTQAKLSAAFYAGELGDRSAGFFKQYGINYAIIPDGSAALRSLDLTNEVAHIGSWEIFYFPENRMRPYTSSFAPADPPD
jgi:hypothetical protein